MASFQEANKKTKLSEGGYVNNPSDKGGETYKGISRSYNSGWSGWTIIDQTSKNKSTDQVLESNQKLQSMVDGFYKSEYWDTLILDSVVDDSLAYVIYDSNVLFGRVCVRWIQRALNVSNRGGKLWPDIEADGVIGPKTINCLNMCAMVKDAREDFIDLFLAQRVSTHLEQTEKSPSNEIFIKGWLNRSRNLLNMGVLT